MIKATNQEDFWNWFTRHEAKLFDVEADQERLFDQLATELNKVHPDLTFEFGPKEARREFVISASGIKSAFPAVTSLVNAAPPLGRWRVTAFRPRRNLPQTVEFRGKRINSTDVQFSLLDNGEIPGIYLFIPGFHERDSDLKQIGYLLLDSALGEYDVESRLGLIEMLPPQESTEGERYPIADLPALFDELVSHLEHRSNKPS
jgi:hypothetical protein